MNAIGIARLPQEILREIFSYLAPQDLGQASLVSKYWRSVANDDALWRTLCSERSILENFFPPQVISISDNSESDEDLEPQCKWARIYRLYCTTVSKNWLGENYDKIETPSYTENVIFSESFIILTLFNVPIVIVLQLVHGKYRVIQRIRLNIFVECSVEAHTNSKILLLTACNSAFIYKWNEFEFVYFKTLFIPENADGGLCVSNQPMDGFNPTKLLTGLAVTDEYIWVCFQPQFAQVFHYSLNNSTSVRIDEPRRITNSARRVFLECERDFKVYKENGELLFTYTSDSVVCTSFTDRFFSYVETRGIKVAACVHLKTSSEFTLKLDEPLNVMLNHEDDSAYCLHFISPDRFALTKYDCPSKNNLWTTEFLCNPRLYFIAHKYLLLRYKSRSVFLCSGTGRSILYQNCLSNQWYLSEEHYDSRVVVKKITSHGRIKFFVCNYLRFDV